MPDTQDKKELLKQLLAKKAQNQESAHFPLSHGQQALWFLYQNSPESAAYNIAFSARILSPVDVEAWKRACQRLINRHPVLRTTYQMIGGQLQQTVHNDLPFDFTYADASHLKNEAFDAYVKECYLKPFNLEHGPICRVFLIRQAENNHVLLFNIHHIACDGVSTWIILQELRSLYGAEVDQQGPNLPLPEKTYFDFVSHQKTMLAGKRGEQLLEFWKKQLAGPLPTLDLSTDNLRPMVQTYNGGSVAFEINDQLTERLRQLAKTEGVTLFAILASAFQVLLHRLSGQEDVIIGTPTTGRHEREFQSIVGYFVNPVALRANLVDNPVFTDFLNRNKTTIIEAIEHQDFPFPHLVKELQLPRDKSRSPVFQVFFSLLKAQGDDAVQMLLSGGSNGKTHDWGKLRMQAYEIGQQEGQFDLTMALLESLGHVGGKLKFNSDLFEHETAGRMCRYYLTLLQSIAVSPGKRVSDLDLLSPAEKHLLIEEVNQTATPYPADRCMHQLFEACADANRGLIAFSMPSLAEKGLPSQFTYGVVEDRANQLANFLRKKGVGPEVKVGICVHRSPEMIIGILGILKAGGAYVPLDPDYPAERLAYIIEDSDLKIILTQQEASAHLPSTGVGRVFLDTDWAHIGNEPATRPVSGVQSNNLAYVIYTSGSTGKPKGVLIEHRGVANKLTNFKQGVKIDHTCRFTLFASFAFDASVTQMFLPLTHGAPLFLMPKDRQTDPDYFWDFMFENRINVVYTVASFLGPMLETPRDLKPLEVKYVFLGAEVFPLALLHKIRERLDAGMITNMYGPTETTVNCVMHTVEGTPRGLIPLGKPLPNYTAYLLDKHLNIAPVGVIAEIHIGGPAVARGYHNQPELTAERFIPDPFSKTPGARLYKSGDLGKYLPDGNIVFMGRVDKQVKVNGYRIEPGEVESALLEHKDIRQALVAVKTDPHNNDRLVAYLIPAEGKQVPSVQEMRAFLQEKLPSFMVPAAYVSLEKFPMLPTGKVDTNALPAPEARPELGTEFVAPHTAEEKLLAQIWSEVLNVERIGIHDNFFDLGGASVQSIQLVNRANEAGFQLTAGMVFEFQTIEQLARAAAPDFKPENAAKAAEVVAPKPEQEAPPATALRPSFGGDQAHVIVESVGTYLPPRVLSTEEILDNCVSEIRFPIEKMTGIQTRRMAGEEEFAIDMAIQAAKDCLSRSKYRPEEVELLICANISRFDGPTRVSYEPGTAMKLRKHFGMKNAMVFDLSNACATMWTAINIIDAFISNGIIRCGMAVSGEYITHITKTAMQEIGGSFLDPRIACLTVGDSGAAVILERSPDKEFGFHNLHMFTESELCRNCIAHFTDQPHGGAIMYVESVKAAASAIQPGAKLVLDVLLKNNWLPELKFDYLLMHQTSSTTINDARREINSLYQKTIATPENMIDNIAHRGNTATTSHWLAVVDKIRKGEIKSGDKIVFGISGSGHTLGSALYTFDDLPDRILDNRPNARSEDSERPAALPEQRWPVPNPQVSIAGIGTALPGPDHQPDALQLAKQAALDCLDGHDYRKEEIGLVIHTGNYRNKFLSEPAMASLVAGDLHINPHPDTDSHNKSFSFDLLNGAVSFLEACYVSIQMLQAGKFHTALITASEIENNKEFRPDQLLGLREAGSALLLHWDEAGDRGFGEFYFKSFPAYLEAMEVHMTWKGREAFLNILKNPNLEDYFIACIAESVKEFLEQQKMAIDDIHCIFPPQVGPEWIGRLAEALGASPDKMVDVSTPGQDLYTSSLPFAIRHARESGRTGKGKTGLLIAAGSGIQVGLALYYF